MTPSMAMVLRALARLEAATLTEVSEASQHSRASCCRYLHQAQRLGYVQRLPVSRRCWRVTDAGRAACAWRAA